MRVERREDANAEPALALLREATGIYISGGDQSRLVRLLVGTLAMECIRMRNAEGVIVTGTSAGASILSALMMAGDTGVGGDSNGAAARKGMIDVVAGFGLLQDIIDQHFSQRGRMGRLLSVFAGTPGLIGIGLDEDTTVLINREGTLETLGSNMVTIIDGRDTISDYFEREEGEVLSITDSSLHVLAGGRCFDLNVRQAIDLVA